MQREFGLHELAVEDARHGHQRPKIEEYGDTVFAVMHLIEFAPTDELHGGRGLRSSSAATSCSRCATAATQGFLGVRERAEREPDLLRHGASFVFYALMDAVVDRYFPVIDDMEEELDDIEEQIFEPGTARQNIERLYALKRRLCVAAPRRGAADRSHRQAARRPRAAGLRALAGLFPRRLRPPGAQQRHAGRRCAKRSARRSRSTCRW